jgi:hypothetical protein
MIAVVSLGHWTAETLGVGGKQNEFVSGGLVNVVGGHQRIPPINVITSNCCVVLGEDVIAAFTIQFSLQRIMAAYHWLGVSCPSVKA